MDGVLEGSGSGILPLRIVWGALSPTVFRSIDERTQARPVRRTVGDTVILVESGAGKTVKKTSAALLAVPLVASMVLAGCSGSDKPVAKNTSTVILPSASTTSAPKPAPITSISPTAIASPRSDPNIPAAARVQTLAGAQAFVRYFIQRWNASKTGPRTGILSPLCHPSSEACAVYEKAAAQLAKAGHHYDGTPLTIKSMTIEDSTKTRLVDILAVLVQQPRNVVDRTGKIYRTEKKKDFGARFVLLYNGKAWSVSVIQSAQ
jgi:hypothetical protein